MARYKRIDTSPKSLPVDLARQLRPGTFEFALNYLLDHEIDLSSFDRRFKNDDTGASAHPPALLLKVMLLAYSQGIVSSHAIEQACRDQITFIALTGDQAPHFTTIAGFIRNQGDGIGQVFHRCCSSATARADPAGRHLPRQGQRELHRPDETTHRQSERESDVREALCGGRTRVRQPAPQQGPVPVHVARQGEGKCAVAAVLPSSQHREAGASRICELKVMSRDLRFH